MKFRGADIDITNVLTVKKSSTPLTGSISPCWSSGVPLSMHMFRADVLRFLPMRVDVNDNLLASAWSTTRIWSANGLPLHTVTLPLRSGNQIPESAGASLLVVYRNPTEPFRKIVLYDGIHIQPNLTTDVDQSLQGFYLSSTTNPPS